MSSANNFVFGYGAFCGIRVEITYSQNDILIEEYSFYHLRYTMGLGVDFVKSRSVTLTYLPNCFTALKMVNLERSLLVIVQ